MNTADILQKLGDSFGHTSVKTVFGDPIHLEGKTVVPIASVRYGFGGGSGAGRRKHAAGSGDDPANQSEGGGGGGGANAIPAGALEITATGTRFIPFANPQLLALAFAGGALFASLLLRRRRRTD